VGYPKLDIDLISSRSY